MKKIFLIIALFIAGTAYSSEAFGPVGEQPSIFLNNPVEYTFSAGDTATTFSVVNAAAVYLTARDSSMTGTDTIYWAIRYVHSNGMVINTVMAVHLLATTTTTTFIASSILIPVDATTATWVWYPGNNSIKGNFTGSFTVTRLNGVNASTPYTPKSRLVFWYDPA